MKTTFDKAVEKASLKGITGVNFNDHGDGWSFSVFWENRPYPNFISSKVKTNKGAVRNYCKYVNTGKFSLYGNANN